MADFREDAFVYPLMVALTACLCEEITASGLPEPCQCALMPYSDPVLDFCGQCEGSNCGGQAWVRLVGAYPSQVFPALDDTGARCGTPIAYQIEVGIVRCIPVGDHNTVVGFTPPAIEDMIGAVRQQTADMSAMKRAISCCLDNKYDDLTYTMGVYAPISGGDCNGGVWQITVWSA